MAGGGSEARWLRSEVELSWMLSDIYDVSGSDELALLDLEPSNLANVAPGGGLSSAEEAALEVPTDAGVADQLTSMQVMCSEVL